jgi:hypothetical protein
MRTPIAALAIVCFSTSAFAAEATAERARAIEDAYAAYFGHAAIDKGLIAVKPDGEAYVVTWDLQRALAASGASVQIGAFSYKLTPEADDGWGWNGDSFPSLSFKVATEKGPAGGAFDVDGFALEGHYDAGKQPFLTNKVHVGALKGDLSEADDKGPTRVRFLENDLQMELRAKTSDDGGVDVALVQALGAVSQVTTPPGGGDMKLDAEGSASAGGITGLRAAEIGALWRAMVVGAESGKPAEGLVDLVSAALPLWKDAETELRFKNIGVASALGSAGFATFGESVKLTGLTDEGRLEIGVDFSDLKFVSPLAPAWADQLAPLSAKIAVALSDRNIGAAARMAIKDPKFGASGELSPETQDAIDAAIRAGDPRIVLQPGRLTNPLIDLAFEGSAKIDPANVSANLTVSADSLDKVLALAADLGKSSPELQSAVLGLTLIKGLAKTSADGRLTWDVAIEGDKVTINGSPLSSAP